jgi:hypothetical protein
MSKLRPIRLPVVQVRFSSSPPNPLNTTPEPRSLSPLGCNPFLDSSTCTEPGLLPTSIVIRARLNNTSTPTKAINRPPSDRYVEFSLRDEELRVYLPKHHSTGSLTSSIRELIKAIHKVLASVPLLNSDNDIEVDEEPDQFGPVHRRNSDTSSVYSLSSKSGQFVSERETRHIIERAGG